MDYTPRRPDFENAVRAYHARTPMHAFMGMQLEAVEPGCVRVSLPRRAGLTQQNGFLHAGALISLADATCGMAAWTLIPAGHNLLSVQISTSLQRAADCERVMAEGVVTKAGKRLMVAEGTVYDLSDATMKPLVKATVTLVVMSDPAE